MMYSGGLCAAPEKRNDSGGAGEKRTWTASNNSGRDLGATSVNSGENSMRYGLNNILWDEAGESDDHMVPYQEGREDYRNKKE